MTRLTEEQMRNMRTEIPAGGVVPPRPNPWMNALDRIIRILTLGKGRASGEAHEADGVICYN